jgi:hypothetical protein
MKRTKEEVREAAFKRQAEKERLIGVKDGYKRRAAEEIERRASEIINKIEALEMEKEKVMTMPMTREVLLETAKKAYTAHRKHTIHEGLKSHFGACQHGTLRPFDAERIRDSFPMHGHLLLQFFVITEKEIEAAIAELPEGITEEEREKRIAQIDKKVAQLREQLEKGT